jgi:hypothetical protein
MTYHIVLKQLSSGDFRAECDAPPCSAEGQTAEAAVEAVTAELRYLLELCPCTTVDHGLDVVVTPGI